MRYLLRAALAGLLVVGVVIAACGGGDGMEGESRDAVNPTVTAAAGGGGPSSTEIASETAGEEETRAAVTSSEGDAETGSVRVASEGEGDGGEGAARVVEEEESEYEIHNIIARDRIPAILDPEFLDASAAMEAYNEHEPVLGLSINGDHRAYPLPFLSQHEIVNDVVGGEPVAVTW